MNFGLTECENLERGNLVAPRQHVLRVSDRAEKRVQRATGRAIKLDERSVGTVSRILILPPTVSRNRRGCSRLFRPVSFCPQHVPRRATPESKKSFRAPEIRPEGLIECVAFGARSPLEIVRWAETDFSQSKPTSERIR